MNVEKIKSQCVGNNAKAGQTHCRCAEHRIKRPAENRNPNTCCKRYSDNIVNKCPEQIFVDIGQSCTA